MERLTVVKIGGNVIDDEKNLQTFLKDFSLLKGKKILVHGGGKLATSMQENMGIPVSMVEGRRITDEATLKIVTMVYAGYVNKTIVTMLQALQCNALGLSGADANCIVAHKRDTKGLDYGFVGDIDKINTEFISACLENNLSPVFSAITHAPGGQLLNTNADTVASELAAALSRSYDVRLVYCFEKKGVLENVADEKTVIKEITHSLYQELKSRGTISSGMIPKLDNAFRAIAQGVSSVHIGKADDLLTSTTNMDHEGTRLSR